MNNIRAVRMRKGMKQSDLAKMLNMSVFYLNRIETGQRKLTYPLASRIAHILECSVDEIFLN